MPSFYPIRYHFLKSKNSKGRLKTYIQGFQTTFFHHGKLTQPQGQRLSHSSTR